MKKNIIWFFLFFVIIMQFFSLWQEQESFVVDKIWDQLNFPKSQTWEMKYDNRFNANFMNKLKQNNIWINDIITKSTISRYELTRILNLVECTDCLLPPPRMIRRYTLPFWTEFDNLPWKDFGDIEYKWWIRNDNNYYYCVSYVWENEYMRWYPESSSPICAWDFCGSKDVTKAEFVQVIINIVSKYIYSNYSANWTNIKNRSDWLHNSSYAYSVLDENDRNVLENANKNCPNNITCKFKSTDEFKTYLKYCMFNIESCNFKTFWRIKSTYRPVSELNIMQIENLFPFDTNPELDIHWPIDGWYALAVIWELHKKIWCAFDDDYDCDGLSNYTDNCPNIHNPTQSDMDGDGLWDACDDDIDWDWIKNIEWLVDDDWNIVLSKYLEQKNQDINTTWKKENQNQDNDPNIIPDQFINDLWVYIDINYDEISNKLEFEAITKWKNNNFVRNFWDGSFWFEKKTNHTYTKPWFYNISVSSTWNSRNAIAKTSINIPKIENKKIWLQISSDNLSSYIPFGISNKAITSWLEMIEWYIDEQKKLTSMSDQIFSNTISEPWIFAISAKVKDTANNLIAYSQRTTEIWFATNRGSILNTNKINIKKNEQIYLKTKNQNRNIWEIKNIQRNFGDWDIINNRSLDIAKKYDSEWSKVIVQTISFLDGTIHTNAITILVEWVSENKKSYLTLSSDKLLAWVWDEIGLNMDRSYINTENIIKIVLNFWDWNSVTIDPNLLKYQVYHKYSKKWLYNPYIILNTNDCREYISQITISISDYSTCIVDYLDGTINTKYKCDMDKDNIPDICDDDIDGDGVTNPLWIVQFENPDCSLMLDGVDIRYPNDLWLTKNNVNNKNSIQNNDINQSTGGNINWNDNNIWNNLENQTINQDWWVDIWNQNQKQPNNINLDILLESINTCSFDDCFCLIEEVNEEIKKWNLINQDWKISINTWKNIENQTDQTNWEKIKTDNSNYEQSLEQKLKIFEDFESICWEKIKDKIKNNIKPKEEEKEKDSDWDGYYDSQDSCPFLPENFNLEKDEDGCPEFEPTICKKENINFNIPKISVWPCNQCPCQFMDFGWQLTIWDQVRAVLMNLNWSKFYINSFVQKIN